MAQLGPTSFIAGLTLISITAWIVSILIGALIIMLIWNYLLKYFSADAQQYEKFKLKYWPAILLLIGVGILFARPQFSTTVVSA